MQHASAHFTPAFAELVEQAAEGWSVITFAEPRRHHVDSQARLQEHGDAELAVLDPTAALQSEAENLDPPAHGAPLGAFNDVIEDVKV